MQSNNNKSNSNALYLNISYAYWNDICDIEPLPISEQKKLIAQIKEGDRKAYDKFVESFLRLVVSRAKIYCRDFDTFMDLVQEGNIGLLAAIEKFDPNKGCAFSTYATLWIDRYIRRANHRTGHPVRIPENMVQSINRLITTEKEFLQIHNREPNVEELSNILNMSINQICELKAVLNPVLSIEQGFDDNKNSVFSYSQEIQQNIDTVEDSLLANETKSALEQLMNQHLSDVEKYVLKLRFGMLDVGPENVQTFAEISKHCGLSKEGVRKIEKRAIQKLQKAVMESGLTAVDFIQ